MKPDNGYALRRSMRRFRGTQIVTFFTVLYATALLCLIIPLRPTYSENEKRELTPFPTFTFASFWNGDYFSGIGKWFSDTFPFRDTLLQWDSAVWSLSGIQTNTIHGDVVEGDEIPDVPSVKPTEPAVTQPTDTTVSTGTTTAPSTTTTKKPTQTAPNKTDAHDPQGEGQQLGAIYTAGNAAYEYYSFNRSASDRYIQLINKTADALKGKATVYDIVVPNSMGVMLSNEYKQKYDISTSDQKKAIAYMSASMNANVKSIEIFDVLNQHKGEYLYFRTDHHWTATGAYYAYQELAKAKGITPTPLANYEKKEFPGFLGTFYAGSNQSPKLGDTPDTVVAYMPKATNDLQFTDREGNVINWNVVMDVSEYGAAMKYSAFIGGDNPYAVVHNPTLTDGSSCVIVKESYGNAFVPFLVDHYQTVHVVDYRYYGGNLLEFVEQNGVQDVIFVNNIMATSTELRIDDMYALMGW